MHTGKFVAFTSSEFSCSSHSVWLWSCTRVMLADDIQGLRSA